MSETLLLGAVAYDPKVVTIWDGFQKWFAQHNFDFDYILYSNYERQVEGHFAGHFHVAWNSPLAWLQTERIAVQTGRTVKAIAMRDTDCDLTSVIAVRNDSPIRSIEDLRGKTIAVGASDSPQATLIPLLHLSEAGLEPEKDFAVRLFDVLVGKHGDHIGGERHAAKALIKGTVDAACMIDGNHLLFSREGTLPSNSTRILAQTSEYDHCNFTVLDDAPEAAVAQFCTLLMSMSYDDPQVRSLLDLEGLKQWRPGRTEKYALLARAANRFKTIDAFVASVSKSCP
ncbi:phosphate/phosphite/phosphonate ABC transporter substrate-binding protein [Nitrosomonas sp.]|uniref:phosphate/phosphite/phosphonate ABC transporter substrate-binding protein n=1 Tax=Nitrosomonas sp. TaxID=42353 RepID=UPI0025CDE71A|nr:phosphate/phosphite/phosphonate ABC transporter substrate-binding protein [Nitrosomonas sp.]MBY0485406.1 phosphate/phosphite/phosphonate ABC transporter substrate-binding protein [Nitrosomonas sp.]